MGADVRHPDRPQPVDRDPEPDRLGDLRGPGLELPWQVGPGRLVGRHRADHVAAADERWHVLQELMPAVQHADPGRPVGLVAGPRVEIDIERAQVHRHLRHRLGAVDEHDGAGCMGPSRDLRHRVDRAEHVRDVHEPHERRPALQQHVQSLQVELAVAEHRHVGELGLAVLAEQLPGDDVGVMLHLGQHDEVAPLHVLATPRIGDQVDGGGRIGGEDGLLGSRPEPVRDPRPRPLVQIRGLDRERIHAAMDRRSRLGVVAGHRIDHRLRRLRGGGRIQIRDRVAVDRPAQHRELGRDVREPRNSRRDRHYAAASRPSVIHP